ncbi:choice-of-anchor Q domain-containing protein [Flavobacteriaceae bacterium S356]|uniref:Probable pectate lyase C n=1 Tax=Asprobacillus argus TaxID=3076534 RepID=A0ABU3LBX0_9FLAO|nr:choice-of-anchor Q domain-containing protein [Flavobacteriaceae bacterium S356]
MRTFKQKLLLFCVCAFFVHQMQGQIIYVDAKSTNMTQNGNSWATAFTSLEVALVAANAGDEIRVAGDQTHKPSTSRECTGCTTSRDYYFLLNTNIKLKGSYNTTTGQQEYNNPTLLSGDIGTEGDVTDNTYHVLVTRNLTAAAEIDGFTITQGNANGTGTNTIDTETVSKSAGGGMFSYNSSPKINNTIFSANQGSFGAGMYNTNIASPEISNTVFTNNTATNFGGAMLNTFASAPKIINTVFTANQASQGAGMYNINGFPVIINATFFGNTATVNGGGIFNMTSTITMYSTVLYNNVNNDIYRDGQSIITASHNFSENYTGTGFTTLTSDPFENSSDPDGDDNTWGTIDDGLIPKVGSTLIDAGDNNQNNTTTDITGRTRVHDGSFNGTTQIDVGAYESQYDACSGEVPSILYVDSNASGANNGSSWTDAYTSLESALARQGCTGVTEIRVAGGQTHTPSTSRECTGCTTSRDYYFLLNTNITLKGSYTANTSNPEERDYSNPTMLSGDIGIEGDVADNTYHVLVTRNLTAAAEIDGFTITQGNADDTTSATNTIDDVTVYKSSGGGMYNGSSSPSMSRIIFMANKARYGAGMYNRDGSPEINNTIFTGNISSFRGGGMFNTTSSSPRIINTIFNANEALDYGGGMYNTHSNVSIINSTFFNNTLTTTQGQSSGGGGMYNTSNSSITLHNTVLYGNGATTQGREDIFNGSGSSTTNTSSHNFSQNYTSSGFMPLTSDPFVNSSDPAGVDTILGTADDGLVPAVGSELIDVGDNNQNNTTTDIAGQTRKLDGNADATATIDVGAYEYKATLKLAIKVFLAGAYDTNASLMRADLGSARLPTNTPHTDGAIANSSVFDVTGANAIVDWVFVELRDKNAITTVLHSSSALLQRDGDVVAMDGTSVLAITATADDYYISISHRNHLPIATDMTFSLSSTTTVVDLTNLSNIRGGSVGTIEIDGVRALYGGDFNGDGQVDVLDLVAGLSQGSLGQSGYRTTDVNLDGQVQTEELVTIVAAAIGKGKQF